MAEAKLIIKPPHMEIRMKPGLWPDLAKMQQTIKDAGFKPIENGIEMRVAGKVVKTGDTLTLELDGMKSPVTLVLTAAKDDPDPLMHVEEKHLGSTVDVIGQWLPPAEGQSGPGSLAVTSIYKGEKKQ